MRRRVDAWLSVVGGGEGGEGAGSVVSRNPQSVSCTPCDRAAYAFTSPDPWAVLHRALEVRVARPGGEPWGPW